MEGLDGCGDGDGEDIPEIKYDMHREKNGEWIYGVYLSAGNLFGMEDGSSLVGVFKCM